ncbi:FxLYD domain-containing protein [Haloarcula marina]|uniref:FxLYD domain-containing protein n=1 Tax=Haloarcula marina TaxID=2961574 RepID=UPI0020B83B7F|nr:FxLYD domain-containing protein [Halomicroarcula marina]
MEGESPRQIAEGLNLLSHGVYETADGVGVTGVVENVGDVTFTEVTATVTLLDQTDRIAEFEDTSAEELESLVPGLQWRFWIPFEGEELTAEMSYRIDVSVDRADTATDASATATTETG